MEPKLIAVMDDDPGIVEGLTLLLESWGYGVIGIHPSRWETMGTSGAGVVLLDLYLGEWNGRELLPKILAGAPGRPVIMMSGQADLSEALACVRAGAWDFLEKPLDQERLRILLRNAFELLEARKGLQNQSGTLLVSGVMKTLYAQAEKAARSSLTVLLNGESGTGKDLLARHIHEKSPWSTGPFIKINCGAIPQDLAESELFGHVKGSFTGAVKDSPGKIAAAQGGTLFLDEVGELPLSIQVKLLRFLENREIQRVGDSQVRSVEARVIAATHRDLRGEEASGRFREDLFYRLSVITLKIPPLRERPEDIVPLATKFLRDFCTREGFPLPAWTREFEEALMRRSFPGNIRELRSLMEQLAVFHTGSELEPDDLPEGSGRRTEDSLFLLDRTLPWTEAKRMLELKYLERQLTLHGGVVKVTAEALGLLPNNLSRRLAQLRKGEDPED